MRKVLMIGMAVGALVAAGAWLRAGPASATQRDKNAVQAFMRGKLDAAKNVVEGLVNEDYEEILLGADQMRVMSKRAEWNALRTEQYVESSDDFQRATSALAKAAKNKNLDAASLAWVQVTMTCINCHKHVRGVAVADLKELSTLRQALAAAKKQESP